MTKRPNWYKYAYEKEPDIELLKRLKDQPNTEETFNIALRNIQNPMLIMDEFGNIGRTT